MNRETARETEAKRGDYAKNYAVREKERCRRYLKKGMVRLLHILRGDFYSFRVFRNYSIVK